jgi:hypothetical protein
LAANADAAAADAAWQQAQSQLEVWKRQSVVYQLYGRKVKTVLVSDVAWLHWSLQAVLPAVACRKVHMWSSVAATVVCLP